MSWFNWTDWPFFVYTGWRIGLWLRVKFEGLKIDKEWQEANS